MPLPRWSADCHPGNLVVTSSLAYSHAAVNAGTDKQIARASHAVHVLLEPHMNPRYLAACHKPMNTSCQPAVTSRPTAPAVALHRLCTRHHRSSTGHHKKCRGATDPGPRPSVPKKGPIGTTPRSVRVVRCVVFRCRRNVVLAWHNVGRGVTVQGFSSPRTPRRLEIVRFCCTSLLVPGLSSRNVGSLTPLTPVLVS